MNIFDHPNTSNGWVCPICKTNADKPVVLIGIVGTYESENKVEQAEQFHLDCLDFTFFPDQNLLAMHFNNG